MNYNSIRMNIAEDPDDLSLLFLNNPEYIGLRIRYISMSDSGSDQRREWVDRSLLHYTTYDFNTRPDILMSTAITDYDVVIFGGEDQRRIADFMKSQAPMMINKVKICICVKSDPKRRAKLIAAGFDDVIDTGRTHHIEFIARIYAIWRRYKYNAESRMQDNELGSMLARVSYLQKIPPKQRAVLVHLIKSRHQSATYNSLRIAASSDTSEISNENLKVIISNLRKFLRPGFRIVSDRSSSYRLTYPDQ